jgi:hypothetical protein
MHSTLSKETDPHDIFVIEPDVVLAARADKAPSDLAHDLAHDIPSRSSKPVSTASAASPPRVDTTFRATDVDNILGDRPATGRWAKRTVMAFLALSSAIAAAAWQHYGDDVKHIMADWTPSFVLSSSDKPAVAGQPGASAVPASSQATAASQSSTQPASPAQATEAVSPALAAAEAPPTLQSMSRDIATMGQQIEQLKASIEQLKAGQEQISRSAAKPAEITEQNPRPRISALPPRPAIAPVRKPRPAFSPAQAAMPAPALPPVAAVPAPPQPDSPARAAVTTDGEPVVRPPMPLR